MLPLTIITTTYNREKLLYRCFQSLEKQTCYDFEWLIIDDGSTDNTKEIVDLCKRQSDGRFAIQYIYKANGGKHTALNVSHEYIRGQYCFVLDSDDILVSTGVEEIINAWKKWENHKEVGRIIFLKAYMNDPAQVICYVKHENRPVNTLCEKRISNTGIDCCDTFRTELFIRHRFPEFPGEKFIGEGSAWFPIELESKAVYINKAIYLCEYLSGGLTTAGRKMRLQNPLGGMYNSRIYMHPRLPVRTRIKKGILYVCYCRFAHVGFKGMFRKNRYRLLTLACWIPGCILHWYWKRKYSMN